MYPMVERTINIAKRKTNPSNSGNKNGCLICLLHPWATHLESYVRTSNQLPSLRPYKRISVSNQPTMYTFCLILHQPGFPWNCWVFPSLLISYSLPTSTSPNVTQLMTNEVAQHFTIHFGEIQRGQNSLMRRSQKYRWRLVGFNLIQSDVLTMDYSWFEKTVNID